MSYLGSKKQAGVYQRIIGQMPPHAVYVEPFAGSASIFFTKREATKLSVLIDRDAQAIKAAKAEYLTREKDFNRPIYWTNSNSFEWLKNNLASGVIEPDWLLYCDPPYVHSTRTSRHRYKFELSDADHERLLTLLQAMPCPVMISGYPSPLYARLLADWRCISYRTRTRGRTLTECLWCNFPQPTLLHDWRFAGQNFRQRTSLKRLERRWHAKLDRMPPLQRGYLLDSIRQRQDVRCLPAISTKAGATR